MKLSLNLLSLLFLALFSVSCSTDNEDIQYEDSTELLVIPESKDIEIEIMELINEYRISKGLNALGRNEIVKGKAFGHTDYMIESEQVSHNNFFSRKNYLVNNVGAYKVSENVAYAYTSAESVVNAWINSEGHRTNLEGDFTDFEVSAEQNQDGRWYFTNIFIKR